MAEECAEVDVDAQKERGEKRGVRTGEVAVKEVAEGESEAKIGLGRGKRDGRGNAKRTL